MKRIIIAMIGLISTNSVIGMELAKAPATGLSSVPVPPADIDHALATNSVHMLYGKTNKTALAAIPLIKKRYQQGLPNAPLTAAQKLHLHQHSVSRMAAAASALNTNTRTTTLSTLATDVESGLSAAAPTSADVPAAADANGDYSVTIHNATPEEITMLKYTAIGMNDLNEIRTNQRNLWSLVGTFGGIGLTFLATFLPTYLKSSSSTPSCPSNSTTTS